MKGYIHQLESFGCADGPGSRFIIFFSGCPLRCLYCHNPDTWKMTDGKQYTVEELLKEAETCRAYWGKKGGITVSGGEPLFQIDFLIELNIWLTPSKSLIPLISPICDCNVFISSTN